MFTEHFAHNFSDHSWEILAQFLPVFFEPIEPAFDLVELFLRPCLELLRPCLEFLRPCQKASKSL